MDFIESMDICAIFANALDNAVEAVQKLPMEADRTVRIKILTQSSCLVVKVTNPYGAEPVIENGRLLTSKQDRENHGLGLASMEHSLNKYGGIWEAQTGEKKYGYGDMKDGVLLVELALKKADSIKKIEIGIDWDGAGDQHRYFMAIRDGEEPLEGGRPLPGPEKNTRLWRTAGESGL